MAGKRGHGEGSIYQRDDGRWCGQAVVGGKRRYVYGKTRRDVQAALRKLLVEGEQGLLPAPGRVTLRAYLERWLEDVVKTGVRRRTYDSYRDLTRLYVLPKLGDVKLGKLQPAHLQQLYGDLLRKGLAPKTVKNVHSVLHRGLAQAVQWGLVPRNVAEIARAPKVERPEIAVLGPEEVGRLLDAAEGTRWEALLTVAIATGMRQGELLGLKWADLDLDAGLLHVRRQLGRDKSFAAPKTGHGRRRVDLPALAIRALRHQRARQDEERRLLGSEYEEEDLVFCSHRGRPLGWRNVSRAFKALLRQAGVADVPFHALRHTAASLLFLRNVHPKVVQERLGHSQISITLDIYGHLFPSMGKEAADKLEDLLGGEGVEPPEGAE